jgi:serine/threonine-protein kinase
MGEGNRRPSDVSTDEEVSVTSLLEGLEGPSRRRVPRSRISRVPSPGDVVAGTYRVDRILGAGAKGVVLAARHERSGLPVAIKILRPGAAWDAIAVERFEREARAAMALSGEHVRRVYEVAALGTGEPYIVMEYLTGIDLGRLLRQSGSLPVHRAVDAVLQACRAVSEAHSLGLVHGNLKPSNLFVTGRGDGTSLVKVLDFGGPKSDEEAARPAAAPTGYPVYKAPEQVRNAEDVDGRADIWSLGAILYELLTAAPPFFEESLRATLAKVLTEPPTPLSERRPDAPPALALAISRCLERDRRFRPQSVGELVSSLLPFVPREAALASEPDPGSLPLCATAPDIERTLPMLWKIGADGTKADTDPDGDTLVDRAGTLVDSPPDGRD